jgi:hypothetical protein
MAEGVFLFFFVLCIDASDILLDFAREDERFFELATRCHPLGIFEDTEFAAPHSVTEFDRPRYHPPLRVAARR